MEFLSLPRRKEQGEMAVFTGYETCKVFGFNTIKYSLLLPLLQLKKNNNNKTKSLKHHKGILPQVDI